MRKLITTVFVGTLTFSVYLLTGGSVQEQVNEAADAGVSPPNRDCTCPVRLDEDYAADAGLKAYQRVTFPCSLKVLPDAGRDVTLPPMPRQRVRQALDVVDWNDCTLAASSAPVAALWGNPRPFVAATRPWCRARLPGQPCLLLDGGQFGDRNVSLCSTRANPATCERVASGLIYFGDSEDEL